MITQAKPSSSGNARVWVKCAHRKFTVRKSKLASVEPCAKCASGANTTKERT